jgi:hypothetical protein
MHHVVWIDSNYALVYGFHRESGNGAIVRDPTEPAKILRAADGPEKFREDWGFLAAIGQALIPAREIVIAGPGPHQIELKKYLDEERPHLSRKVVGVGVLDQPEETGLVELARLFFRSAP